MSCAPAAAFVVISVAAAPAPAVIIVIIVIYAAAPVVVIVVIVVIAGFASSPVVSQYLGSYRAKQPGFCTYILTSKFVALTNSPTLYSAIPIGSRCNRDSLAISCPPGSFTHPTISFVASRLSRPF